MLRKFARTLLCFPMDMCRMTTNHGIHCSIQGVQHDLNRNEAEAFFCSLNFDYSFTLTLYLSPSLSLCLSLVSLGAQLDYIISFRFIFLFSRRSECNLLIYCRSQAGQTKQNE